MRLLIKRPQSKRRQTVQATAEIQISAFLENTPGVVARLCDELAEAGINIRMIDQGSSEINIIVGVETADFEKAVRAIYSKFVK